MNEIQVFVSWIAPWHCWLLGRAPAGQKLKIQRMRVNSVTEGPEWETVGETIADQNGEFHVEVDFVEDTHNPARTMRIIDGRGGETRTLQLYTKVMRELQRPEQTNFDFPVDYDANYKPPVYVSDAQLAEIQHEKERKANSILLKDASLEQLNYEIQRRSQNRDITVI